jgi:hypothetical protein
METNLNIPNLTSTDNDSLLTCRALQAKTGKFVSTTVKLIEEGDNETYLTSFIFQLFFRVLQV